MTRLLILLALIAAGPSADAQGLLGRARDAARRGVERAVTGQAERRAEDATNGAIDGLAGEGTDDVPTTSPAPEAGASAAPAAAFVNYDFVPGDRVLFAEDFSTTAVGDFPVRLGFVQGNFETAEWQGRRFLRATSFGAVSIDLPETLPDRFTLEFDAAAPSGWTQEIHFADEAPTHVRFSPWGGGLDGGARATMDFSDGVGNDTVFPVKVMADGGHVKVYLNGTRVANVPTADLGRSRRIVIRTSASAESPVYIGDVRVAEGGRDLAEVAAAVVEVAPQGPLVLTGVVFDTGRATLRPESGPVLDAVAASLAEHPEVRVRVEGHTDATGAAETNRALSQARAEAVAAALAARGVDAVRLEAQGFGPDQPVADNATAEGRQQNRRVALVRL